MINIPILESSIRNSCQLGLLFYGKSRLPLPPGNVHGPIMETNYLFQYCMDGCGELEIDGKQYALKKGDCVVIYPGQFRIERTDKQDPWSFIWFSIQGRSAEVFFEQMEMTKESPVLRDVSKTKIPLLLDDLVSTADIIGSQADFLLCGKLLVFFNECLKIKQVQQAQKASDQYVAQAVYYLEMHYAETNITIGALAKHLGLNRSYLYELFKEQKGISPQEYLTRLRIQKACELLHLPQVSVTSAALSVGYEPSVFTKTFKRVMGITPAEYKKNI